jgi:hypothetical protein
VLAPRNELSLQYFGVRITRGNFVEGFDEGYEVKEVYKYPRRRNRIQHRMVRGLGGCLRPSKRPVYGGELTGLCYSMFGASAGLRSSDSMGVIGIGVDPA